MKQPSRGPGVDAMLWLALIAMNLLCVAATATDPSTCFSQPIAAWYDGSGVQTFSLQNSKWTLWTDKSGNGLHGSFERLVDKKNVGTAPQIFDGSDTSSELYLNGEPVVYGNAKTLVHFPGIVFREHTVFNLCKYRVSGTKKRILEGTETNAIFGFQNGRSGAAMEGGSGFIAVGGDFDSQTDWVLSAQSRVMYRGNGVDLTTGAEEGGDFEILGRLDINDRSANRGDWACAEIIIVNAELSVDEIECVENYFNCRYGLDSCDAEPEPSEDSAAPSAAPSPAPTSTNGWPASGPSDCTAFNIDGFLNECSADFAAEQEALEAVEARVTQLTSADLATNADLAAAVSELSGRLDSLARERTRANRTRSSARMAPAHAQLDTDTDTSVSWWILSRKDLLIVMSLGVNTVLITALLVVLCRTRTGKGYKAVGTFAESDTEPVDVGLQ